MNEEQLLLAGKMYNPGDAELRKIKLKTHNLCIRYNQILEDETEERQTIIQDIFKTVGETSFFQGPIYIHYGTHTTIGKQFFANFNFTVQDDAEVFIGDNCSFGPNVTIVTPIHPLVASERLGVNVPGAEDPKKCYAKPVKIGNNCWFGANVTVCPGVTIGNDVVIGAGSVVTKDIPDNVFAAGVPCKVIREITEADSVFLKEELF